MPDAFPQWLLNLAADTLETMRGLNEASEQFMRDPNDGARADRLTAWQVKSQEVDRRWKSAVNQTPK